MLFGQEANIGSAQLLERDMDVHTTNNELVFLIENNIQEAHRLSDNRIARSKHERDVQNKKNIKVN